MIIECPNCGGPAESRRPYDLDPRQWVFCCNACGCCFMKEVA